MPVAIVGNGAIVKPFLVANYPIIIAADGGFNTCQRLGITPTHSIGDADSITTPPVDFVTDHNQDTTDLMKAIALAKQLAANESIELFGVTSSDRLDHTQAAFWALQNDAMVTTIHTTTQTIVFVKPGERRTLPDQVNFSIVPTTAAAVVEIINAKWSGRVTLNANYSGISNQALQAANITVVSGCVYLLWT